MRWWIRLLLFWIFPPLWAQHDMYLLKLVFNYIYDNPAKCGDPFKYEQWLPAYQNCSIPCNPESALCLRNTQIDLQMCRELPNTCVAGIREFLGWSSTTTILPTQTTTWTTTVRPSRRTTIFPIKSSAVERNAHNSSNQNTSTLGQGSIIIRKIGGKENESLSRKLFDPRLYPSTTLSPVNRIFTPFNRIPFEPETSNTVLEPPAASVPNSLIPDPNKNQNKVSSTLIQRDVESNFVQSGDPYADILGIKMEAASTPSPYGEADISFYDELEKAYDLEQAEQNKSFANQSRGEVIDEMSFGDHDISIPAEISNSNFNNEPLSNEETLEPFIGTSAIGVPSVDTHVAIPPKDEDLGVVFGNPSLATNDIIYPEEANPGDIKHYDESNKLKKILSVLKTIPIPTTTTQATTPKGYRKTGRTLIYSIKRRIQSEKNPLIAREPSIELLKEMKNDRRYHRLIVEQSLESKIDKFEHCCEWALAGMCDRHWQKVRKYCPRSCGLLVCEDLEGLQSCTRLLDVNPEECYAGLRQSSKQLGLRGVKTYKSATPKPKRTKPTTIRYKRRRRKQKKRSQNRTTKKRKLVKQKTQRTSKAKPKTKKTITFRS